MNVNNDDSMQKYINRLHFSWF